MKPLPPDWMLWVGATLALLLPLTLYFQRQAHALGLEAAATRRQLLQILASLREGLFEIGRDLRLSATCSTSIGELLHLQAPTGRHIEDVLQPLLDRDTLEATLTFLQLLWSDAADEHAVEALNPLSQVEVAYANARGGAERRYLSFSFRRVVGIAPRADAIVAVVADVTDRVVLARELEQAETAGDSQAGLLLQLVRADPVKLVAFLDDADSAFRKSNAILTAAGSSPQQLQKKLITVMRELDALTSAADTLPFANFTQRLQSIDDVLSGLSTRSSLAGNDFLPAVVRLDELMEHAATMRAIHQHIVLLRAASAALASLDEHDSIKAADSRMLEAS
jgi:two-component system chemotaxis sensor kinase CheA